ncbi:MMPL family transporter [Shewanella intestini]|uniref:MMPL family transporter n=1 Tax=Shewanella intestini TaxID=2017544 RepID=A0ABS5I2S0_9GAMM|nr:MULTISPECIES: MMPL family transporter [Shewanella]MBR9728322.1 MMPL family transporter [Shewanella intestini]MRG35787.1 MMPL family transporter [Shewanella sp. XMDDZSB0408]
MAKPEPHAQKTDFNQQHKLSRHKKLAWLWLCCQLTLVAFLTFNMVNGLRPQNNFLALLPVDEQRPWVQDTIEAAASSLERRLVFIIGADDKAQAQQAAQKWQQTLTNIDNIEVLSPQASQQAYYQQLFPYRYELLDSQATKWLSQQQADKVTQRAMAQIYNPFAGVSAGELKQDPWLLFRHYMQQRFADNRFDLQNGLLHTQHEHKDYFLIQAKLTSGAYARKSQQVVNDINRQASLLEQTDKVEVLRQGVAFYVTAAATSARNEISLIGGGSLLGIIALIILTFKSIRPLLLCLLSISLGVISAASATILFFGGIHSFTLVIGASLIGVSVDYAFHYLSYRACCNNRWDSIKAAAHLRPVLVLGLASSVLAYGALLGAQFPGLNQVAVFSSAGLIASLLSVLLFYPLLTKTTARHQPIPLANGLLAAIKGYQQSHLGKMVLTTLLLLSALGISQLHFDDDVRLLQSAPAWLKHQEAQISTLTGVSQSQQWMVLTGHDQAQLREAEQTLSRQLQPLVERGVISGFSGVFQLLPANSNLKHNYQQVAKLVDNQAQVLQQNLGLTARPQLPAFTPLNWDKLKQLAPHMPYLWGTLADGEAYSVIMLTGVTDTTPLMALQTLRPQGINHANSANSANQADNPSPLRITYVSRADEISQLLGDYRSDTLTMLLIAYVVVFIGLALKYSAWDSLLLLASPLLASLFAIALPGLFGIEANVFNVIALLLIFGIGIDYSLFLRFHLGQAHAALAVLLAGLTTLLSFGLMAVSTNHGIASFGLTIAGGILASWLLAPLFSTYKNPLQGQQGES